MTFWFWVLWEFELCVGRVADPTFWIRFRCYPPVKRIRIRTSIKSGSGSNIFFTVGYHSLKLLNSQLKLSAMATIFSLSIFWIRVRLFWPNPEPDFSKSIYQDMSKSSGSRVSGPRYTDWIRIRPFRKSGDGFSKPESTNLSGSGLWQKNFEVLYPDSGMQTVSGPNPSENPHLDPRFFQTLDPDPTKLPGSASHCVGGSRVSY